MDWWIWILIGLALLALEVAIPGSIIMLFFGVSAMVVGVLVALGLGGPLWLQAVMFSVLSVVSLLTLRGPILKRMGGSQIPSDQVDALVGKQAIVLENIAPMAEGKVELRGTPWVAVNAGESQLTVGQKCHVHMIDGLKLHVR